MHHCRSCFSAGQHHPLIHDAVAITTEDSGSNGARLHAYAATADSEKFDEINIQPAIRERLPAFMIPSEIVQIDEMSLAESGEIDRRSLPAPNSPAPEETSVQALESDSYTATVVQIFGEVLRRNDIGPDDDFFLLGGESLMATRVMNRLQSLTGIRLQIDEIFNSPTAAELAVRLDRMTVRQRRSPSQIRKS